MRAGTITDELEVGRRVDVVDEIRYRRPRRESASRLRGPLEALRAARPVERLEEVRARQPQSIRAAVGGRDEGDPVERLHGEQRAQILGPHARKVGVDDEDAARREPAQSRGDRGSLTAARIVRDLGSGLCGDPAPVRIRRGDDGATEAGSGGEDVREHREHDRAVHVRLEPGQPLLSSVAAKRHDDPCHVRRLSAVKRLTNAEIAAQLEAFAALLDLNGSSFYTSRAYRRAAETIGGTEAPVAELVASGRVQELRGVGAGIAARLQELVETGRLAELDELQRDVRPELLALAGLLGIGPKRMLEIGRALEVSTADEFRDAARAGRLRSVPGIGPQTEERLLAALEGERSAPQPKGLLLNQARALLEPIAEALGGEVAGDPRRWADLSFELAVVCAAATPGPVLDRFASLPVIVSVLERESRRAVGVTVEGVAVELVVATPGRFGTELVRATGSRAYVDELGDLPAAPDERSVYAQLGLPWCPPELREGPFRTEPPKLLTRDDIRGDLHVHSTWSDGKNSILEMATAARELGYEYLAICDHTPNVRVVPGLDADALRRQAEEIAGVNEELAPFRVLRGTEVDIRSDGTLDLPDDVLSELEWVQLSLHAGQREPREKLTRKVTEAMRHPAVRALSHPKGRMINRRPPNELDLERTFEVALETGVAIETNGLPDRLDLSGPEIRLALQAGVPIVVSTDSHSVRGLDNMRLAVHTARRGWASAANVVNTRPLADVLGRR
jgi:DNA polymerase (family X)